MKKLQDVLLAPAGGTEILMGNHALVRAMLEADVRVVTSYPGSPTPEIADGIMALPKEANPLYFEFSTNEKVATEVAFGASINGHLSCVFFKSVGLNVAADTFVQLGHMELIGGMVIILGDDPGANSSQNEQDNRHFARLSYIPILEPSTPGEAHLFFKEAARLSQEKRMPVILRMTTHVCHAKDRVNMAPLPDVARQRDDTPRFRPENGPYLPITSMVFPLKERALRKLDQVQEYSNGAPINQQWGSGNPKRGIITAGLPYLSLLDVLDGAEAPPDILKLGMVYPLPHNLIVQFLRTHQEVKILEELDDFLEVGIKALAYDNGLSTQIVGKQNLAHWMGEYTPDKVATILSDLWPDAVPQSWQQAAGAIDQPAVPPRPPQMCPGCGHRSAFHAVKRALAGTDTITVADIGCHSLGILPPYQMGQVILCMGHVSGTAAGLSLFNKERPVLGFIGDSTFYHAGLPGLINASYNGHRFTLVIMENGTTAMTGHQDHPGTGMNAREATEKIPIKTVLEGLGITEIHEVDAYQQEKLTSLVKRCAENEGLSVIIARHPCMLKQTRLMRRKGRAVPPAVQVGPTCDRQLVCIEQFACPSYQKDEDGTIRVEPDLCIGDRSCLQTCPTMAIIPGGSDSKNPSGDKTVQSQSQPQPEAGK